MKLTYGGLADVHGSCIFVFVKIMRQQKLRSVKVLPGSDLRQKPGSGSVLPKKTGSDP